MMASMLNVHKTKKKRTNVIPRFIHSPQALWVRCEKQAVIISLTLIIWQSAFSQRPPNEDSRRIFQTVKLENILEDGQMTSSAFYVILSLLPLCLN